MTDQSELIEKLSLEIHRLAGQLSAAKGEADFYRTAYEQAAKDSDRLDWLAFAKPDVCRARTDEDGPVDAWQVTFGTGRPCKYAESLRDAIDEVRTEWLRRNPHPQ